MRKVCLAVLICASLTACKAAAPAAEFKAVATTQDVMASLVDQMAQNIWNSVKVEVDEKGTHETRPQTKEDWQKVGYAARGLAEASTLLLYEGRLEDHGDWEKLTQEMAKKALDAAKAADDQDPDAITSTGGDLYETCTKCHMAYLEKVQMKRTGGKPAETSAPASK